MTKLTRKQIEVLETAFEKGGGIYVRGSRMGGAIRRCCERLAWAGLLDEAAPFPISVNGLRALCAHREKRYADCGCEAYRLDLVAARDALTKKVALETVVA